jgi:type VI secretion system secreted protein Hcp
VRRRTQEAVVILFKFAKEIKGESTISEHKEWINASSFQFGVGRGVSSPSDGTGKREVSTPSISEVVMTRNSDLASPELFFQGCGGQTLELCTVHFVRIENNVPKVQIEILLTAPMVSGYSVSSGGDNPSESVSLNFTKISFQYNSFDGAATISGTPKKWDMASNVSF